MDIKKVSSKGTFKDPLSDESSISSVHKIDDFEDSPIEEVRASIPPTDDPSIPAATFRAWIWGVLFSAAISFTNQVSFLQIKDRFPYTYFLIYSFFGSDQIL